jgi:hypothetical protein
MYLPHFWYIVHRNFHLDIFLFLDDGLHISLVMAAEVGGAAGGFTAGSSIVHARAGGCRRVMRSAL